MLLRLARFCILTVAFFLSFKRPEGAFRTFRPEDEVKLKVMACPNIRDSRTESSFDVPLHRMLHVFLSNSMKFD